MDIRFMRLAGRCGTSGEEGGYDDVCPNAGRLQLQVTAGQEFLFIDGKISTCCMLIFWKRQDVWRSHGIISFKKTSFLASRHKTFVGKRDAATTMVL